ncbi:MAG: isochorismatase family protein [Acidobacteriaceae bacterium]
MTRKESYFTPQSIESQAADLLQQATALYPPKGLRFQPDRSSLLVLDMQAYFLDASSHAFIPSARAIVDGLVQLIDAYSSLGRPIFFTQHVNSAGDAGMMATWWKDVITDKSPFMDVIPELSLARGTLIRKSQYDAFYQTPLEELLHARNVTQLVLCGVMTHLCVETTARSAFMRGYQVFLPVDGTATYTLSHHQASLLNLAHGFASIVLIKDLLTALRGVRHG